MQLGRTRLAGRAVAGTVRAVPGDPPIPPVVDATWLREHHEDVVVADVRWYLDGRSGLDAHHAGHVPGAVWVDVDADLSDHARDGEGRHPLPTPEAFAAALAARGIGDGDIVVAYDDTGGVTAGRLVWLLRATGRPAALLDGGLAGWDGPLESGGVERAPRSMTPVPWPSGRFATVEDVDRADAPLLDARAPDRYRGASEPVDPRAGHIPHATSLPAAELLADDGRLLDGAQLRERFKAAGVGGGAAEDEAARAISSCGSGVTACLSLLAMERAGLPPGRLYVGSFSQWSRDPDRDVATGD